MRVLLIACLLFFSNGVKAQTTFASDSLSNTISNDSTRVSSRSFDAEKLGELKSNEDFNYAQPPSVAESLWDRLLIWIQNIIGWLLQGAIATNWGRLSLYALGLVVLIVIVMLILKVDAFRVFYAGADQGPPAFNVLHENIHEMDFELLIRQAMERKDFRLGVRLTFLYALKLLADKQLVDWKPGKTNHDYVGELTSLELRTGLNELSFFFEYAWYGQFPVNDVLFAKIQHTFNDWKKKIA